MLKESGAPEEIMQMNADVLSFVGDGVQTLAVRTALAISSAKRSGALHRLTAQKINATSQAQALKNILHLLNEEEYAVYKRCRNHKTNNSAKNASVGDYRIATGFEGLIGFLYLTGRHERLSYLLEFAYNPECLGSEIEGNGIFKGEI